MILLFLLAVCLAVKGSIISASFNCDHTCKNCNDTVTITQSNCTYVDVAKLYIQYDCLNGGKNVTLTVFGPFHWMCGDRIHKKLEYPSETCYLPPGGFGGYTIYHCPPNVPGSPTNIRVIS